MSSKLWTAQRIAEELQVSSTFISQVIKGQYPLKRLKAEKIGRQWLVEEEEALRFIKLYREPDYYTPKDIADKIGRSRKYVQDQLTGYGGQRTPSLKGEKKGNRWVIYKKEAEDFIRGFLNKDD